MFALLKKLWNDEDGSIIATEYLMLGSIVTLGTASGLAEVRDSMNEEYKEYGNAVRDVRQSHSVPAKKGAAGSAGGSATTNAGHQAPGTMTTAAPLHGQQITFSAPTP